jgi:tetratricopeptide (TPR) repeat protein
MRRVVALGTLADTLMGLGALASLETYRGRYAEGIRTLESASRILRREGDAGRLFANLLAQANAFLAIGGRTRASELIDEAIALDAASPTDPVLYFQLGHLMARVGRLYGAREAQRLLPARNVPSKPEDLAAERVLTASIRLAERTPGEALAALGEREPPPMLQPFRLAIAAEANAMAGQHDAAVAAARRLADGWHFGAAGHDEWLRAGLRVGRYAELSGDSATALTAYRRFVERWRDADVFLIDLSQAHRGLTRLGASAVATFSMPQGGFPERRR